MGNFAAQLIDFQTTPGVAAPGTHGVEPSRCSRDLEIHRAAIFFFENKWDLSGFHGISMGFPMGFHGYVQDFMGFPWNQTGTKNHLE